MRVGGLWLRVLWALEDPLLLALRQTSCICINSQFNVTVLPELEEVEQCSLDD